MEGVGRGCDGWYNEGGRETVVGMDGIMEGLGRGRGWDNGGVREREGMG